MFCPPASRLIWSRISPNFCFYSLFPCCTCQSLCLTSVFWRWRRCRGDNVSCPLEWEKKHPGYFRLQEKTPVNSVASVLWGSVIWPTSCRCIHQPPEPHQPARSRAGEDDGQRWIRGREVGERAARDGGRERDDRGVNKQCTVCVCVCVCVLRACALRCVILASRLAGWRPARPVLLARWLTARICRCRAPTLDYNMTAIISPHYPPQCVMMNFIIAWKKHK